MLSLVAALVAVLAIAACGDSDEDGETSPATTAAGTGDCSPIEDVDVPAVIDHPSREFTLADYETVPPAAGDHPPFALQPGRVYDESAPLGEAVHMLEHGGVIVWTNGLSEPDTNAIQDEVEAALNDGYYMLATFELPELEGPMALSAWGALQNCEEVDPTVIRPFIDEWYASPKSGEAGLACQGSARDLPPC